MSDAVEYTDLLIAGIDSTKVNEMQILADQIQELRAQKKVIEETIDSLTESLSAIAAEIGIEKVAFPSYSISYSSTTTKTISESNLKMALLNQRIQPEIIAKVLDEAVKVTVSPPKAKIYPRKAKE